LCHAAIYELIAQIVSVALMLRVDIIRISSGKEGDQVDSMLDAQLSANSLAMLLDAAYGTVRE
jgi:hypothetical protein